MLRPAFQQYESEFSVLSKNPSPSGTDADPDIKNKDLKDRKLKAREVSAQLVSQVIFLTMSMRSLQIGCTYHRKREPKVQNEEFLNII